MGTINVRSTMKGLPMSETPSLAHTLATTSQASPHRACSLFLDPDTGLVVGYYEADDARAAAAAMEALEVNTRWQAEMAQYFQPDGGGTAHFLSQ